MDAFPEIERTENGWYSQRWEVHISRPLPSDLDRLGQELGASARATLLEATLDWRETQSDPIEFRCSVLAAGAFQIVVAVRSEHPNWRMGASLGTLQEIDRRFHLTHVQRKPREQLPPWYLAQNSGGGTG